MTLFMVNFASRVRVAVVLSFGCAGVITVAIPTAASAQAWRETPSGSLARNMRVLADSPKSFEALIGAGKAALELGDTQAAVGFFGRADEVYPASPVPQIGMGAAAVADGNALEALAFFARAKQLGARFGERSWPSASARAEEIAPAALPEQDLARTLHTRSRGAQRIGAPLGGSSVFAAKFWNRCDKWT